MKRIHPSDAIIALSFFVAATICIFGINDATKSNAQRQELNNQLIIKSRAEKLTESEFIQLSDSDKLTVLNNYQK